MYSHVVRSLNGFLLGLWTKGDDELRAPCYFFDSLSFYPLRLERRRRGRNYENFFVDTASWK